MSYTDSVLLTPEYCIVGIEQVSEAAKQISTLKAREDEQRKRRLAAEEDTDKIRKARTNISSAAVLEVYLPADKHTPPPIQHLREVARKSLS